MIKLHFEKLSRFERINEPCNVAIPFPQGELKDLSNIAITDGSKIVPSQFRITARWADDSVKWLLANFLADLPGNKSKDYYFSFNNTGIISTTEILEVSIKNERVNINTGKLQIEFCKNGESGIFHSITHETATYEKGEIIGPIIYDNVGKIWKAHVGEQGWEIIEDGPVRAIIQTKGKHLNASGKDWIDYTLRIYAYAGKPWIRLDYQIINREDGKEQEIKGIELRLNSCESSVNDIQTAIATSNYKSKIVKGTGYEKLYHLIDAKELIYEANEHFPETFYGTFWADWRDDKKGGVCATIFQAHQNFPKAMEVDKSGISIRIVPCEAGGVKFIQGMGKTHRIFLHFHSADEAIEELNIRSLQFQLPDRPVLEPEVYERAKVFDDIFVKQKIDSVEIFLINLADSRAKAYGILHWGDAPDPGYTQQGRGSGEPVWTNNEYDFPHAAMLMYAKSGERRMLDYMLVAAEHWMDVDVCHYSNDPLRHQAQIIHSTRHATGEVEVSHEWVEGLFDYYHQTGEQFAYDTALGIGENILRQLAQPKYQQKGEINARETGWALRALVALYKETYDEKWLEPAEKIIKHFEAWKEEYGAWLSPYTDHTSIRVPFMISIAVGSLMRYYRIRPQATIKNMIIDAVDDMIENCMLENGLFYYKELPSLRRMGNNTLTLETLTNAYELTGNTKYLKAGLPTFKNTINSSRMSFGFSKQISGDALILQGPGPKMFAQSFYPITAFYTAATKAGIL